MANEPDTVRLNPNDPFEAVLIEMVETNRRKRHDYAGDSHFLSNFYETAEQLSLSAGHSVEQLIATKQARLKVLLPRLWDVNNPMVVNNEPIEDTLLDRAVYSVLAMCIFNDGGYVNYGRRDVFEHPGPENGITEGREGTTNWPSMADKYRKPTDPRQP